jgi:hypothetical protein
MVYVKLPSIGLEGEWSVTGPECTLAAHLVAILPPAPAPDADVVTRWEIANTVLEMVLGVVRDNGKMLFGDKASMTSEPGKITMVDMPFAIARMRNETELYRSYLYEGGTNAKSRMETWLDGLEAELARLREILTEAATQADEASSGRAS